MVRLMPAGGPPDQEKRARRAQRSTRGSRDWGKTLARALCLVFGLIGLVPLSGGLLLRSSPVLNWAERETSRLLAEKLGLSARYDVALSLLPLKLEVKNLVVPDQSEDEPAIFARLIAVQPRFFSLLAGRIDVGDIEIADTSVRLVIEEGRLQNIAHRFVRQKKSGGLELDRAPFRSLAITSASVDLRVDGRRVLANGIDVDTFVERGLNFDLAVRVESALVSTRHALSAEQKSTENSASSQSISTPGGLDASWEDPSAQQAFDEDRLCALDLRAELSPSGVFVRRLSLLGIVDDDPATGSLPACDPASDQRVALRMSQLHLTPGESGRFDPKQLPTISGQLMFRAPMSLLARLDPKLEGRGWAGFSGSLSYDGQTRLPELSGRLSGAGLRLNGYGIASSLRAELLVTGDVVRIPEMEVGWGNGTARLRGIEVRPFDESIPLRVEHVSTQKIDMPGVMRDVNVTEHAWVDWNFGRTEVRDVRGTIVPFTIDGAVDGRTKDFVVWDRGFDDPARRRMVGIDRARVVGRFRAHQKALEFYDCLVSFGESRLPVDLVSVGFRPQRLVVRLKEEGGTLELADLSPVADIDLAGRSDIYVDLEGPMKHPILEGTLAVDDLVIGGFEAGNIERSKVHFEPLFVEFRELKGRKGVMDYALNEARLDFDGPAKVEFTSDLHSERFSLSEFFEVFHFDEDPRFEGIFGEGRVDGQLRYLLGGPDDACGGGRLLVEGTTQLDQARALGEEFSGGEGEFYLDWFDMEAGMQGMRVDVPHLVLRKGSGSLFGSLQILDDGPLWGDLIVSRIPISRLDMLGPWGEGKDGFLTGFAHLSGSVDAPAFSSVLHTSELQSLGTSLPASHAELRLVAGAKTTRTSVKKTGCGRPVAPEYDPSSDDETGRFELVGRFFGGQVLVDDMTLERGSQAVVRGQARIERLDAARLATFFGGETVGGFISEGHVTGRLDVEEYFLDKPFDSKAKLSLSALEARRGQVLIALTGQEAAFELGSGELVSRKVSLSASRAKQLKGTLDLELRLDSELQLDAAVVLRPTSLSLLASSVNAIEQADGSLSAELRLQGPLNDPVVDGQLRVTDGSIQLPGIAAPVRELDLDLRLNRKGLVVERGTAEWGGGSVEVQGRAPLARGVWGAAEIQIATRRVQLALEEGVEVEFDSQLNLSLPTLDEAEETLPRLSGTVDLLGARYEKPMNVTADLASLAARGAKTEIESYDPTKDHLRFDILFRSNRPLVVENELVETTLRLDPAGVRLTGTNQRFGAVGTVEVEDGGKVFLRRNEFELQSGLVRFNDPTELSPEVDVSAVTEYRRYDSFGGDEEGAASGPSAVTSGSGNWRIVMHAYGPPDNLTVDLSSDPPLAQDDIFLLLTVGLTRTELDQSRNSGVGSSVALEALGTLSGAESAVTDTVPVDEFRFGSTFSSRSGRTEPTVTIGKRLSERIRASVTTSLSETSEVRSNVEYRATEQVSVEGSFDNGRNVASAAGGNLGGDVRWRIEFR